MIVSFLDLIAFFFLVRWSRELNVSYCKCGVLLKMLFVRVLRGLCRCYFRIRPLTRWADDLVKVAGTRWMREARNLSL